MKSKLKSKIWYSWPLMAATVVVIAVIGSLWFFQPKTTNEVVERPRYGSLEKLSRYTNLRNAYLIANGGEEKLTALQSMQARGFLISGEQSMPFRTLKRRPDQSLTTLKFPNYDLSFGVNGTTVWQRVQTEGKEPVYELKEGAEASALQQMGEFFDPIMNVLLFNKGQVEGVSPSEWESQPAIRLDFKSETGIQTTAYIDPDTMRPLARIESFTDEKQRTTLYSQYQSIGGMQEPFIIETYNDGALTNRVEIEKSEHNVGTVASIFEYPSHASPQATTETVR